MSDIIRRHVWISGRVQGVTFRYSCASRARETGVTGWVRNRPGGEVEALFEGERGVVDAMAEWCHIGPPAARVASVRMRDEAPQGESGFLVL
jgi:acylphosphatase